jgi:hypothetical protein
MRLTPLLSVHLPTTSPFVLAISGNRLIFGKVISGRPLIFGRGLISGRPLIFGKGLVSGHLASEWLLSSRPASE